MRSSYAVGSQLAAVTRKADTSRHGCRSGSLESLNQNIVRVADRERVKIAADHYKSHKSTLRDLRKLHSEELKLLKRIVELRTRKYE